MKKVIIKSAILSIICSIFAVFSPKMANFTFAVDLPDIKISAKSSYLIDANSGTEIISNNSDDRLPVASMTKLATLAVVFDQIKNGKIDNEDMVTVSNTAAATEGSSAFLDANSSYLVADLIKTIVVVSANDSCVALAEHIAGTEDNFVKLMNKYAEDLGLTNTHFQNCTGLPQQDHYSSAKDMAKIYQTVCNNSQYMQYSKIWMEDFIHPSGRKTGLVNTNRLIKTYQGCDSGKTGYTSEAKYCLTASATRGQTKLIAVVIGANTSKERFNQVTAMFNYGFANYLSKTIVSCDIPLATIAVAGSKTKSMQVYAKEEYVAFVKKGQEDNLSVKLDVPKQISAPIKKDQIIGTALIVNQNNIVVGEVELVAQANISKIKFDQIMKDIFTNW